MRCVLLATVCAHRHVARIASGGGRGSPRFFPCHACPDGAEVAARLEAAGWKRPRDEIHEVLSAAQWRAREAWRRTFPGDGLPAHERSDPLRSAARETPDDGGIEPDAAGLA